MSEPTENAGIDVNEEQLAFYYSLGGTLTQWVHVERALHEVAMATFHDDNKQQISALCMGIDSFSAKVKFIDTILKVKVSSEHNKEWQGLKSRAEEASKIRNRLAHDTVIGSFGGSPGQRKWLNSKKGQPRLHLEDIVHARFKFFALMCSLENYACSLVGVTPRFPKEVEEVQPRYTIQQIMEEMYLHIPKEKLK